MYQKNYIKKHKKGEDLNYEDRVKIAYLYN